VKLAVPAYFGPWQHHDWSALIAAQPSMAVINPDTGPGSRRHAGYRPLVAQLANRGCAVLGYVTTSWLTRSPDAIAADVATYRARYSTSGVLLDEIAQETQSLSALRRIVARIPDDTVVVLNPGRRVPDRWRVALPVAAWITFEGSARQYLDRPIESAGDNDWHLVHSVSVADTRPVAARLARNGPAFSYVTRDRLPNPWDCFDSRPLPAQHQPRADVADDTLRP
jgi:Spherulation-specific family 4